MKDLPILIAAAWGSYVMHKWQGDQAGAAYFALLAVIFYGLRNVEDAIARTKE
jgi:hypothetical protein